MAKGISWTRFHKVLKISLCYEFAWFSVRQTLKWIKLLKLYKRITIIKKIVKLITSIILPSKFLLSPFPRSNVGIGTATVWPIAGVPSSFLLLVPLCLPVLGGCPWPLNDDELCWNQPCNSDITTSPHTKFHIRHGCICELLRFPCHKHSTSRYPEIKKDVLIRRPRSWFSTAKVCLLLVWQCY